MLTQSCFGNYKNGRNPMTQRSRPNVSPPMVSTDPFMNSCWTGTVNWLTPSAHDRNIWMRNSNVVKKKNNYRRRRHPYGATRGDNGGTTSIRPLKARCCAVTGISYANSDVVADTPHSRARRGILRVNRNRLILIIIFIIVVTVVRGYLSIFYPRKLLHY